MNELLIGIDWSQEHYDVCIIAESNAILSQFRVSRNPAGLERLAQKIDDFQVPRQSCLIGIETSHDIMVDFLRSQQFQVYVIPPSIVNRSRGRFGNSGAYSDRTDARLIAELLRTDRARFAPWRPDSALLTQMKVRLHQIDNLTKTIIQHNNRLKAILMRAYPQPLSAFSKLSMPITLQFLIAFPSADACESVSYPDFALFCRANHCYRTKLVKKWYTALQASAPTPDVIMRRAYEAEIVFLAQLLLTLIKEKKTTLNVVNEMAIEHPDHRIFSSLPGMGKLLSAKFLTIFGEDRQRFPSAQSIRQLAGTCPVTKQSGKKRQVAFRNACNHAHRNAVQQYSVSSIRVSDWAWTYYSAARQRGKSKNDAFRRLANRWLGIIWKLWQTGQLYDESYHLKQIHKHRR